MDQADFQKAWEYPTPLPFDRPNDQEPISDTGSGSFDWDIARDGQVAILAFGLRPGSDLFLNLPRTGYSLDDWNPAALAEVEQPGSRSTLTLNYHFSAYSNTPLQVSELLPPGPQSQSGDNLENVLNHAAAPGAEPSLRLNPPLELTSSKCPDRTSLQDILPWLQLQSNSGQSDLILRDANLAAPSGVEQLPATARFSSTRSLEHFPPNAQKSRRCTRCWTLRKKCIS